MQYTPENEFLCGSILGTPTVKKHTPELDQLGLITLTSQRMLNAHVQQWHINKLF